MSNPSLPLAPKAPIVRVPHSGGTAVPMVVALDYPNGQDVAIGASSASSTVFDAARDRIIEICSDEDCWYSVGLPKYVLTVALVAAGETYVPGDTFSSTGDTGTEPVFKVLTTQVVSVTLVSGGSGGKPGSVTLVGTTGQGNGESGEGFFQLTGTVNAAGELESSGLTISVAGDYTTNPDNLSNETVVPLVQPLEGVAGLEGAEVSLVMGIASFEVVSAGIITATVSNPVSTVAVTGAGSGATVNLTWSEGVQAAVAGAAQSQFLPSGDPRLLYVPVGCVVSVIQVSSAGHCGMIPAIAAN